jgi:hypothetical protein
MLEPMNPATPVTNAVAIDLPGSKTDNGVNLPSLKVNEDSDDSDCTFDEDWIHFCDIDFRCKP